MRGLGIGDWGLANPQSPSPNPHNIKLLLEKLNNFYYVN
jgi:hypothetical protein